MLASQQHLFAQAEVSPRYEIILNEKEPSFDVIAGTGKSLFIYRHLISPQPVRIELIKLDSALNEAWKGFIPLEEKYVMVASRAFLSSVYFLLQSGERTRKDLLLVVLDQQSGAFRKYLIKSYLRLSVAEFRITRNAVLIGGYFNRVPLALYFNFEMLQSRILPGLFNEEGELADLRTYADDTFDVLLSAKAKGGAHAVFIKKYGREGNLLSQHAIVPEEGLSLLSALSVASPAHGQLVAGVYGNKNSLYSRGVFVAAVGPDGHQPVRYYEFGDLKNFFSYLNPHREKRIRERVARRKDEGKRTKFNYRLMVRELIPYGDQYLLLGEAFYPKYKESDSFWYGGFFRMYYYGRALNSSRVFDGYWFTHAVILSFNRNGELLWDNSIEMNDVKKFSLEQLVRVRAEGESLALSYFFEDAVYSKVIYKDQVLQEKSLKSIYSGSRSGFARDILYNKLDYWYDNFLFTYGVEYIDYGPKGKKSFCINRIAYPRQASF